MPTASAPSNNGVTDHGKALVPKVTRSLRPVVRQAIDQGAVLRPSRGRHPFRLVYPDGAFSPLSSTSTDPRASRNLTTHLRDHGFEINGRVTSAKAPKPEPQLAEAVPEPVAPTPAPSPPKLRHTKAQIWAWFALQPERREFTIADVCAELDGLAESVARKWLKERIDKGRLHIVRRQHKPGQRGLGTPVYSTIAPRPTDEPAATIVAPAPAESLAPTRARLFSKLSEGLLLLAEAAEIASRLDSVTLS